MSHILKWLVWLEGKDKRRSHVGAVVQVRGLSSNFVRAECVAFGSSSKLDKGQLDKGQQWRPFRLIVRVTILRLRQQQDRK